MWLGGNEHCRITNRNCSANESTQDIDQEVIVCIQLDNMPSLTVTRSVRERWDWLKIIREGNTHFLDPRAKIISIKMMPLRVE